MPPYAAQDAPALLHENDHDLSLFDASLSKPQNEMQDIPLESPTPVYSEKLSVEASFDNTETTPFDEAAEETKHGNDDQDNQTESPSFFDRILDFNPCTIKVANPSSALFKERHCCECGRAVHKLKGGYRKEIRVRTVVDEETGETSTVEEKLYFMPSCLETREMRDLHKNSYRIVLAELHEVFAAKRRREEELRRRARAEARAKAKSARKRKEAERSAALLEYDATLAQAARDAALEVKLKSPRVAFAKRTMKALKKAFSWKSCRGREMTVDAVENGSSSTSDSRQEI